MSPGGEEAIRASVVDATAPAAAAGGGATAAGVAISVDVESPTVTWLADAGTVGNFWNSTKLTVCGSPSSVMAKSFAVSPSIGRPSLSLTLTVCTINRVVLRNVAAGAAGC